MRKLVRVIDGDQTPPLPADEEVVQIVVHVEDQQDAEEREEAEEEGLQKIAKDVSVEQAHCGARIQSQRRPPAKRKRRGCD